MPGKDCEQATDHTHVGSVEARRSLPNSMGIKGEYTDKSRLPRVLSVTRATPICLQKQS